MSDTYIGGGNRRNRRKPLENNLKEGHEIARKNLNAAAKRQKMTYDVKVRPVTYKVGDLVWRNQKRNAPGLKSKIVRHGSSWKS